MHRKGKKKNGINKIAVGQREELCRTPELANEDAISQFGVSKNTCARRDKKKHIFFFFCHAKYTHEFALKKNVFLRYA